MSDPILNMGNIVNKDNYSKMSEDVRDAGKSHAELKQIV